MIGQNKILNYLDSLSIDNFPHFIILIGPRGGGKTVLCKYIAKKLSATLSFTGIKVGEIRETIDTAYHVAEKTVYCVKDADTMRNEAKNAMLKITEEPPKNSYFVMTVQDESTLLDTIKSRANVLHLDEYSEQDLIDYYTQNYDANPKFIDIATTPYELDIMMQYGQEFIDYVELVVDNIGEVASANAFKSSSKLALKNEDGYDLKLFWNTFVNICLSRIKDNPAHYANGVVVTSPYIAKCMKLGVNKQQLYDSWVFEIREAWL